MLNGSKPFTPQGEVGSCEFSSNCMSLFWGLGLWQDCFSASPSHLSMGVFSFVWCIWVTQLVSGFLSEGIIPYLAVDSVCPWQDVSSRASYVAFLNQNVRKSIFLKASLDNHNLLPRLRFFILNSDLKSWGRFPKVFIVVSCSTGVFSMN